MKMLRSVSVLSLILAITACDKIKAKLGMGGEEDAASEEASDAEAASTEDAGAAETSGEPAALADNQDDIARFPDETKLDNVQATAERAYSVRDAPPAGTIVTTLTKGQTVTQIASRQKYFLITFDDAKEGKKLMGWVHEDVFSAAPAKLVEPKCAAGESPLIGDTSFCGKICTKDADCEKDQACKGTAAKWNKGKPGDKVSVCAAVAVHDAGAPPASDGGLGHLHLVTALDGGRLTTVVVDAGAAPTPIPTPTTDVVAATGGRCAPNYVLVKKDGKCHKLCPKAGDCRAAFYCGECEAPDGKKNRVCNGSRNFCP